MGNSNTSFLMMKTQKPWRWNWLEWWTMKKKLISFSFHLDSPPPDLFLVACTRLYKPLCPSVGRSLCLSLKARSTRLMAIGLICRKTQFSFNVISCHVWLLFFSISISYNEVINHRINVGMLRCLACYFYPPSTRWERLLLSIRPANGTNPF